mgnify:CR=1 FL=1
MGKSRTISINSKTMLNEDIVLVVDANVICDDLVKNRLND